MDAKKKRPHLMALLLSSTTVAAVGQPKFPIKFSKLESRLIDILTSQYVKKMSKSSQINYLDFAPPSSFKATSITKGLSKRSKSMSLIASGNRCLPVNEVVSDPIQAIQFDTHPKKPSDEVVDGAESDIYQINNDGNMKTDTFNQSPSRNNSSANKTASKESNRNPRRVFTAPALEVLGDGFHDLLIDDHESDDEFFHASNVRTKFDTWKSKSGLKIKEDWDDDFEIESMELPVPGFLEKTQNLVRSEGENIRKFALHIEAETLMNELRTRYPEETQALQKEYFTQTSHVQTLIALATQTEDSAESRSEHHHRNEVLKIMEEIVGSSKPYLSEHASSEMMNSNDTLNALQNISSDQKPFSDRETLCDENFDDWDLENANKEPLFSDQALPFEFSNLPHLIQKILHLKADLSHYITKLKLIN